jgi:hypothetical protein
MKRNVKKQIFVVFCSLLLIVVTLMWFGCLQVSAVETEVAAEESAVPFWEKYTPEQWERFLKDKIVPYAAAAIAAISSLYMMTYPIIKKANNASGKVESTASKLEESAALAKKVTEICQDLEGSNNQKFEQMQKIFAGALEDFDKRNEALVKSLTDQFESAMLEIKTTKESVERHTSVVERDFKQIIEREGQILKIGMVGFGGQSELVKKGIADDILKIGEVSEHDGQEA